MLDPDRRPVDADAWRQRDRQVDELVDRARRARSTKCEQVPGSSCSSASGLSGAKMVARGARRRRLGPVLDDHLRIAQPPLALAVVAQRVGGHLGAPLGRERDVPLDDRRRGTVPRRLPRPGRLALRRRPWAAGVEAVVPWATVGAALGTLTSPSLPPQPARASSPQPERAAPGSRRPPGQRQDGGGMAAHGGRAEPAAGQLDHERRRRGTWLTATSDRPGRGVKRLNGMPTQPRVATRDRGASPSGVDEVRVLVVPDRDRGPHARDEAAQRARLGLRERVAARSSRCRAAAPVQRYGKLRLRSTPRAFWRVFARRSRRGWRDRSATASRRPGPWRRAAARRRRGPAALVAVDAADHQHGHRPVPDPRGADRRGPEPTGR